MRLLHTSLLSAIAIGAAASLANAQGSAETAKSLQADYAVPDAPALKMLDVDASKLLRPVTAQAFTAALATATGGFSYIPRAFAVEFSPAMLRRGEGLTLKEYEDHREIYRARFSFAAKVDSGAASRSEFAAAMRFGLDDQSDLRTNTAVRAAFDSLTKAIVSGQGDLKQLMADNGIPASGPRTKEDSTKANLVKTIFDAAAPGRNAEIGRLKAAAKKAMEEAQWNASVFDLAIGVRGSAVDSTGAGMQFDGVAGWATKGWALGRGRQLLFGARGAYERDFQDTTTTELKPVGDAALRLYAGSNRYKALTELQATARRSDPPKWLAKLGGEAQLAASMWIDASIGYQAEGKLSEGKVISSFKLKFQPGS